MTAIKERQLIEELQAAPGKLLVRRMNPEKKSEGGIALPDSAVRTKPCVGIVFGVGEARDKPSTWREYTTPSGTTIELSITCLDGAIVYFTPFAGDEIEISDETIVILDESQVLAFIPKPEG